MPEEARRLWQLGESSGDSATLDRALELDSTPEPDYVTQWGERGLAFARAGMFTNCRKCLERAVTENPADLEAQLNLGCLHLREGSSEPAIRALEAATRTAPQDERGWNYLANAYALAGRFPDTLNCLDRVTPSSFTALLRGRAFLGLERFPEAVTALDGVPEAGEWLALALRGRARRTTDFSAALEDLKRACSVHPDEAAAWVELGQLLARERRWADALGAFQRALDMAWSIAAMLGAVEALDHLDRPYEALRLLVRYERVHGSLEENLANALVRWLTPRWEALVIPDTPFDRQEVVSAARQYSMQFANSLRLQEDAIILTARASRRLEVTLKLTQDSLEVIDVVDSVARSLAFRNSRRAELPPLVRPEPATGRVQWVPELRLGGGSPEKFGGPPEGLPLDRWPVCECCHLPMSFLAQLDHHPPRLDLAGPGRRAYVFFCQSQPGDCEPWEAHSGANAVVILEKEELAEGPTVHPDGPQEDREVSVTGWIPIRDTISAEDAPKFLDRQLFVGFEEYPHPGTRLGGSPFWHIDPDVPEGYTFAGQFAERHEFWTDPPTDDPDVQPHPQGFTLDGPNFGAGVAMLFLKGGEGAFLWQS